MPDRALRRLPEFRHIFTLRAGGTVIVSHRDAKRVLDRRSDHAPVETVWEVKLPTGAITRLWPEEIVKWEQEAL